MNYSVRIGIGRRVRINIKEIIKAKRKRAFEVPVCGCIQRFKAQVAKLNDTVCKDLIQWEL